MLGKTLAILPIVFTINAVLLVAGVLPMDTTMFSWLPTGISPTELDVNTTTAAYTTSSTTTIATDTGLGADNPVSWLLKWIEGTPVGIAFSMVNNILFGFAIALKTVLPPALYPVAFIFLVPIIIIEILAILYLILTVVSAVGGGGP